MNYKLDLYQSIVDSIHGYLAGGAIRDSFGLPYEGLLSQSRLSSPTSGSPGLAPHQTGNLLRGQSRWRVGQQPAPLLETGQYGCSGSWVRRDCHESSRL